MFLKLKTTNRGVLGYEQHFMEELAQFEVGFLEEWPLCHLLRSDEYFEPPPLKPQARTSSSNGPNYGFESENNKASTVV